MPAAYPTGEGTPLGNRIAALLADPAVSRAHWGIAVTSMDGTPLYGLDEGKLFRPASTAKLFTTAAAMAMLGPDRRFTTQVVAEGHLNDGVLHGNLLLVGGGDANFASPYLLPYTYPPQRDPDPLRVVRTLAHDAAAKGLRKVEGPVIGDDTHFFGEPYPEGWAEEDILWGYGAPVSALAFHDNEVDVTVTASPKEGERASIAMFPAVPYYTANQKPLNGRGPFAVYTIDWGRNTVEIERAPNSHDLSIDGNVAAKYGPDHEEIAMDDPAVYGAIALREALRSNGVIVPGSASARHSGPAHFADSLKRSQDPVNFAFHPETFFQPQERMECQAQVAAGPAAPLRQVLAEHVSPPLLEDVILTLKTSDNLHAEIMLRNIEAERGCGRAIFSGAQLVHSFLLYAGIASDDFVLYDGSGLSMKDVVTSRAEAALLAYAAKQPWFPQWKAGLPIGGVDGTLANRFKEAKGVDADVARLKGHVFAKTGTLGESRALAGYVECASGRTMIFSVLVDNHLPGTSADREAMDRIVAAIADTQ